MRPLAFYYLIRLIIISFFVPDRKPVSVSVNRTPAVEPAPPVKTATTTCRSRTTSAAKVSLHLISLN